MPALAVILLLPTTSSAWRVIPRGAKQAGPIAIDARRDIFAAISLRPSRYDIATAIVKLAHADGAELWRRPLRARGDERSDEIHDLEVVGNGDLVAAGSLDDNGHTTFFVVRISGADGRVRWRRLIRGRRPSTVGTEESASAIAVDAAGNVVAVGSIEGPTKSQFGYANDFAVVKFDGRTGEERWRFMLNGTADDYDFATSVGVDRTGDVIAIGLVRDGLPLYAREVRVAVKLARDDGRLLWRRDGVGLTVSDVVIDGRGDAVIASASNPFAPGSFDAIKLAGTTGDPLWVSVLSRGPDDLSYVSQLRVLSSGDVVAVGGSSTYAAANGSWIVARLDGETGAARWSQVLKGSADNGWGSALAIASDGDIVVGGTVVNARSCYDAAVARLDATEGDVLHLRSIDGTATASECERPECGASRIPCGPTRKGIDQDRLNALAIDAKGRIAIAGVVCNGSRGREHGFVARLPGPPTAPSASPPAPRSSSASRP